MCITSQKNDSNFDLINKAEYFPTFSNCLYRQVDINKLKKKKKSFLEENIFNNFCALIFSKRKPKYDRQFLVNNQRWSVQSKIIIYIQRFNYKSNWNKYLPTLSICLSLCLSLSLYVSLTNKSIQTVQFECWRHFASVDLKPAYAIDHSEKSFAEEVIGWKRKKGLVYLKCSFKNIHRFFLLLLSYRSSFLLLLLLLLLLLHHIISFIFAYPFPHLSYFLDSIINDFIYYRKK